jgi:putative ABC transport system permease protein
VSVVEAVRLALLQIRVQKLKSVFTVLGVMLGVMFLVAVVSVVDGIGRYMDRSVIGKLMTVNGFEVHKMPTTNIGNVDQQTMAAYLRRPPLYERDTAALFAALPPGFRHAVEDSGTLSIASPYTKPSLVAVSSVTAEYFAIKHLQVAEGRPFTAQEDALHTPVVVIGADVKAHFFPGIDPLGRELRIHGLPYRVVGIVEPQGSLFGLSMDRFVITPYNAPARRLTSDALGQIDGIIVQSPNATAQIAGEDAIRQVLRTLHGLHPRQPDNFAIETPQAAMAFVKRLQGYLIVAGVVLPAIGLVVGALVIMNIMVMAVAERTREIGLRKSIGARRRDILWQFLIESMTLSACGATVGIGAGIALTWIIAATTPLPTQIALWSVLTSIGLGIGVGMIAGVYPASRAAQLDPIIALHTE